MICNSNNNYYLVENMLLILWINVIKPVDNVDCFVENLYFAIFICGLIS